MAAILRKTGNGMPAHAGRFKKIVVKKIIESVYSVVDMRSLFFLSVLKFII